VSPGYSFVFLGRSITSSWGNGHATTYRGLLRELAARGHDVRFLERDLPSYAANRDLPAPPYARTELYQSLDELKDRFHELVRDADLVVVGSYVLEGAAVAEWVLETAHGHTAFYDLDTPVTVRQLQEGTSTYLTPAQVPRFGLYLSFTGGPILETLATRFGAAWARPLFCSVDPKLYYPEPVAEQWDLGYLGTYSSDRQPVLDRLLCEAARAWPEGRFVVAGPQYPPALQWPPNVARITHLAPDHHRAFYNAQRFALNVTRRDMSEAGFSPSPRLFESAACGTPLVSDPWPGLDAFFAPGTELLVTRSAGETLELLRTLPRERRARIAENARHRALAEHTAAHRAETLETYTAELLARTARRRRPA
jgi:spore maturation protein CgeB